MGKQGPCYHCGVTSTPLWRNGPPEKPVLCNACGSRWRTKGSLVNYTPLHARPESENLEDSNKFWKVKATTPLRNKELKILKRKFDKDVAAFERPDFNHGFSKGFDEDTSNRSSSGSAISNSESFVPDASELTGPTQQPVVWDSTVPSRKRTCITRTKPSSVEKLNKDLYTLWHKQQQSPSFSGYSEEDLLLVTDKPMVSVEIGHGSVLIKHPNYIAQEEESVASSLSFESKQDTVSSRQMIFAAPVVYNGVHSSREVIGNISKYDDKGIQEESIRDKDQLAKSEILSQHNAPLHNIHLPDLRSQNNNIKESKPVASLDGFDTSVVMKRPQDVQLQKHTGQKIVFKSPRAIIKKLPYDQKELINKDGNTSSSNHLLPSHSDSGFSVTDDSNFTTESSDQDLLLDVPINGSFPQAELLLPTSRLMF